MASRDIIRTGIEWLRGFAFLIFLGILFGCVSAPLQNPLQPNATPSCSTVTTQEPYQEQVCQNVSKMDQVCANRELNYSLSPATKTYLCSENNLCVNWLGNGTCVTYYCSNGMTRCTANLTNLDPQKSGTWSVGANFSLDGKVFGKNPVEVTLLPSESEIVDFDLFYGMDINQLKADCSIFISTPSRIQDCSFVTTTALDCQNVTKYRDVEKQVCG